MESTLRPFDHCSSSHDRKWNDSWTASWFIILPDPSFETVTQLLASLVPGSEFSEVYLRTQVVTFDYVPRKTTPLLRVTPAPPT